MAFQECFQGQIALGGQMGFLYLVRNFIASMQSYFEKRRQHTVLKIISHRKY
jgi:hypothetical protein